MPMPDLSSRKRRNRKRKRREVSESSSSDDSDDSSTEPTLPARGQERLPPAKESSPAEPSDDESDSDVSSEAEALPRSHMILHQRSSATANNEAPAAMRNKRPDSPAPPSAALAPFLPLDDPEQKTLELRDRFRKYWMASIADGFADDLEEIRKEPSMTKTRLEMLVDSLASGADVFTLSTDENSGRRAAEEMKLVLGER